MSMNTRVVGLRDSEGAHHEVMVQAVRALHACKVYTLPPELADYFDRTETTEVLSDPNSGLEVDIAAAVSEDGSRDMVDALTVDVRKLPKGVTHIRLENSY